MGGGHGRKFWAQKLLIQQISWIRKKHPYPSFVVCVTCVDSSNPVLHQYQ